MASWRLGKNMEVRISSSKNAHMCSFSRRYTVNTQAVFTLYMGCRIMSLSFTCSHGNPMTVWWCPTYWTVSEVNYRFAQAKNMFTVQMSSLIVCRETHHHMTRYKHSLRFGWTLGAPVVIKSNKQWIKIYYKTMTATVSSFYYVPVWMLIGLTSYRSLLISSLLLCLLEPWTVTEWIYSSTITNEDYCTLCLLLCNSTPMLLSV